MHKIYSLLAFMGTTTTLFAAEPVPSVAQVHANPTLGFQGEWVSRFCSKDHRWQVDGANVKMLKRDAQQPVGSYDNRHAEGSTIMVLGSVFDQSDRGIRLNMQFIDPDSGRGSKGYAALTLYWNDPATMKKPYYGFNDMIRPAEKVKQCS